VRPVVRAALAVASRSAWRSHHDALAVKAQHQQVGIRAGGVVLLGVRAGHIGGRGPGERLELALAGPDPARALEGGAGLLERPARRLDRDQAPQPWECLPRADSALRPPGRGWPHRSRGRRSGLA
jgi:hypothetical protein